MFKKATQKDSNKHRSKCWKHYHYALAFTRNNNPVALRVSLVLRNPLGLELISSANPLKEQSHIVRIYAVHLCQCNCSSKLTT